MLPRQIRGIITYNDKDISASLGPYLKAISYRDNMSGEADDLELTLEDRAGLWQSDWFPDKGAMLDVSLLSSAWSGLAGDETLRLGSFAIDEIESSGMPSEVSIKAVSIPENNELRGVERSRSWEKTELQIIAKDVAEGAGMKLVYDTEENPVLDRAEQTEQSDLSFLMQLCRDQGLALKICEKQVIVFDEAKYEEAEPLLALVKPGALYEPDEKVLYLSAITGYRFQSKIRDVYRACHVQCQKGDTKETIEATFTDPGGSRGAQYAGPAGRGERSAGDHGRDRYS